RAVAYGERAEQVLRAFAGQADEVEMVFLFALALFARYGEDGDPATLDRARALAARVSDWEQLAPTVFAHKARAVEAADARAPGGHLRAAGLYARAAASAAEIGFTHYEALAHELAGRALLDAGEVHPAREKLGASREAYERWGALAKVADVDETLAGL